MENEKRLIDANALESDIRKMFVQYCDGTYPNDREAMIYDEALVDVLEALEEAPTVDAVEVVRCKDCKHRENLFGEMCCPYYEDLPVEDNHYCAYGERRAENGNKFL